MLILSQDVFTTTHSSADYGVVPFENSSNGSVVFTLDQLADRDGEHPDLSVCAEIYLDVHHCLLGYPAPSPSPSQSQPQFLELSPALPADKPSPSLGHIKRVYSHPQAFGQCARFLGRHLRGVETVDVSSTSRAAELARADRTGESAAVSSAASAARLGLHVLARDVEDRADNTTRFFVLRRGTAAGEGDGDVEALLDRRRKKDAEPDDGGASASAGEGGAEGGAEAKAPVYARTKSLASFTVPHGSPGALADVLECFRRAGLNLTSIGSRPSLARPFRYVFFVEFEGHRFDDPEGRVRDALEDVARVAQSARWLGSWESMR